MLTRTTTAWTIARLALLAVIVLALGRTFVAPARSADASTQEATVADSKIVFYIGTYTAGGSKSKGIYRATLDPKTGDMELGELAAATTNPSFLAMHPKLPVIYAVNEVGDFEGKPGSGGVGAFLIGNEGKLTPLGSLPSGGEAPCYVSITPDGKTLLVANYGSGSVASYRVGSNGAIEAQASVDQHHGRSANPQRQEGPHAHSIRPDLGGCFAIGADLGTDRVYTYRIDAATSRLTVVGETPANPGSGPRHVVFHPNGHLAYVVDEMASNVTAFDYHAGTGSLSPRQTLSTLPNGYAAGTSTVSEVAVHPSGKFLYVGNRGHDSIAVYAIDETDGTLAIRGQVLTRGKSPRHFAVDPSGRFLIVANQKSDELRAFSIDAATGALTPTGSKIEVGSPSYVLFSQPQK